MASRTGSVHVATTRREYKGKVYESHLLRRTFREDGKVKNETVGNLSHLPAHVIEMVRRALAGESFTPAGGLEVVRSRAHGHVALVLGLMRDIGLDRVLSPRHCREQDIVLALVAARILFPGSKLASTRAWAETTLLEELGLDGVSVDDVYAAMDWLRERQEAAQRVLVGRHLPAGSVVLYDLSSSYVTGRHCPIAVHGYSRDGRGDLPQVNYGVVTDTAGRPVAVEVFPGNQADSTTVMQVIEQLRKKYKLRRMVLVGDRGMVRNVQIEELAKYPAIDWITAIGNPAVAALHERGHLQLGLFDDRDLVRVESPDFPGQRLIACRNVALRDERARKRELLLQRTERELQKVKDMVDSGRLRGAAEIGERVGRAWGHAKMRKHFRLHIAEDRFTFERDEASILAESALDGIYVIRTSIPASETWPDAEVVRTYKSLSKVERVFRTMKTTELLVRPIFHRDEDRVRAHIFLCMLAAHVAVELERRLAAFLHVDEDLRAAQAERDPVRPQPPSASGRAKRATHKDADGNPLHSLRTLLGAMASQSRVSVRMAGGDATFDKDSTPTDWQRKVAQAVATAPT